MIYQLLRRLLFRLDAERAHELAAGQMERLQKIPAVLALTRHVFGAKAAFHPIELWGLHFSNPLGLAAGFDKNARMVPFLRALGFGFVEVGTVTLDPQPGNPRPRIFRHPGSQSLVNRLGFNNEGARAVADRLAKLESGGPLLVNIGKNREVPLTEAGQAYRSCYEIVAPYSDGIVVNLSSPNTPGLRDLQRPEHLREILGLLLEQRARTSFHRSGAHPILVKIAPDLDDSELRSIAEVCGQLADGIVATNTTVQRPGQTAGIAESGGLSGRALFDLSTDVLRRMRALVERDYPLVGVGGIFSAADVQAKLDAGANLVECYTGFVYRGPALPRAIAKEWSR